MARQAAKTNKLKNTRNRVMTTVKNLHGNVLTLTEDFIEGTVTTANKYQKVAASAIKKTEPLIEKQVDLVFDSAEAVIDQVQSNSKRFQKLLGIEKQVKQATKRIGDIAEKVSDRVEDGVEDAREFVKNLNTEAYKKADKAAKSVAAEVKEAKADAKKVVARKTTAAKKQVRKTTATAKKTTASAKKTVSKAKTAAKKTTATAKKTVNKVGAEVKETAATAKKAATTTRKTAISQAKKTVKS